jgi:hypothetical protein
MTHCLLDDLHTSLHIGEKCPECGHDPYADPEPADNLRAWGWAPGHYLFTCQDCPKDMPVLDKMARLGDKRSVRCREHAIAARDAAAAVPPADPVGVHLNHCYQGEFAGTCKYGETYCPAAAGIYVIWWTTQSDCEFIVALCETEKPMLAEWPTWLRDQFASRVGRSGRGRLWNAWPDVALVGGVEPWPDTLLGRFLNGTAADKFNAGGIVVPLGELNLVIGLPGFVTNDSLTRLLIHALDLDL